MDPDLRRSRDAFDHGTRAGKDPAFAHRQPRHALARARPWLLGTVVLAVVVGCGAGDSPPAESAAGAESAAPPEAAPPSAPEVFAPGVISDDREQYRVAFTPSGDTAYFGAGDGFFPQTREATIYRSIRVEGEWQAPEVASFSGRYSDIDPFITADGRYLYFSSIRPMVESDGTAAGDPGGDTGVDQAPGQEPGQVVDLWRVTREGAAWGAPERLAVSTPRDDLYPSVDADGNLYFANSVPRSEGPDHWRVVVARVAPGGWGDPEPIPGPVNTDRPWAFNPAISPDGRRLVFTRLDPLEAQATGFGELYLSRLDEAGRWSEPVNLGSPVNTGQDEYHASFSPDGTTLYFVRRDPFSEQPNGSLYRVDARVLERVSTGGG